MRLVLFAELFTGGRENEENIKVPNNKKCNYLSISGTSDSGCHYFSSTVRALRKISPLSPLTT